ncbi:hypothetical protein VEE15_01720 [Escherichia coli]|nr:hypothetical protein VEE15_01720 [Escherichia coli]
MLTEQQRRELDWEKTDGLMPVIVQHAVSGEVLMLGYMNPEALDKTIESGKVTFFSRTLNSDYGPKAKRLAISSMW